ncbi:hypothetical protein [Streptomyces sp. Tu6071]|uniref:hypothetical protein n=1 Tax=Streptomyces sp. Tu6071 TaxID=355249 RepID=UPI00131A010F|nr:hypothetical protein [Streptomyces sp. Tu6071]
MSTLQPAPSEPGGTFPGMPPRVRLHPPGPRPRDARPGAAAGHARARTGMARQRVEGVHGPRRPHVVRLGEA